MCVRDAYGMRIACVSLPSLHVPIRRVLALVRLPFACSFTPPKERQLTYFEACSRLFPTLIMLPLNCADLPQPNCAWLVTTPRLTLQHLPAPP